MDGLNRHAKLILCEKCYPIYNTQIEPTITAMLDEFFFDWQGVEANVRFILAKYSGAFKKRPYAFDVGLDESLGEYAEYLDVAIYDEIRRCGFSKMVAILKNRGIIKRDFSTLLFKTAERRNRLHRYKASIPESDRILFFWVHQYLQHLAIRLMDESLADQVENMLDTIEEKSKLLLAELEKS